MVEAIGRGSFSPCSNRKAERFSSVPFKRLVAGALTKEGTLWSWISSQEMAFAFG